MTTRTSDNILFKKEFEPRKGPLFHSRTNLCNQIHRHPESPYKNYQLTSLKSLVSLMLLPATSPNSRPISDEFKDILFKCIEEEFPKDKKVYLRIVEELEAAFKELKDLEATESSKSYFSSLITLIEEGDRLAFCNFIPTRLPKTYALDILDALKKRFEVVDSGAVFFFFSCETQKTILSSHWQGIKERIPNNVYVSVCCQSILVPPLVIAEPTRNSKGFYLHGHKEFFDPYPLNHKYIENWESEIFLPFEKSCRPFNEMDAEGELVDAKIRRVDPISL